MIDKKELYNELSKISYDILDNIVGPVCGIGPGIWADIFAADLGCYTMGDEAEEEAIIKRICDRYDVPSLSEDEFISPIEPYWPLATIALYIIVNSETDHWIINKDDLY